MKRILAHAEARKRAHADIDAAPDDWIAECRPPGRNGDQNAHFHALVGDIVAAGMEWAGKKRNADQWKVLLVSGHAQATKEGGEIVPGIEGEFVAIRESTALMSRRRCASLIEYTIAWMALHDVPIREPNG